MTSIQNPFPNPITINLKRNEEIRNLMASSIQNKQLTFFDMVSYLEKMVENKDKEGSMICGYYLCNTVINQKSMSMAEKNELIYGFTYEVNNIIDSVGVEDVQNY